jgi:hypothetical protein
MGEWMYRQSVWLENCRTEAKVHYGLQGTQIISIIIAILNFISN